MRQVAWWLLITAVVILVLWLAPLAFIWSLNTLFHLGIDYTLATWAAALILESILTSNAIGSKK